MIKVTGCLLLVASLTSCVQLKNIKKTGSTILKWH
jgi:hypothetical protein